MFNYDSNLLGESASTYDAAQERTLTMRDPEIVDSLFQKAASAIDEGDLTMKDGA
jgi:hypothetical protein